MFFDFEYTLLGPFIGLKLCGTLKGFKESNVTINGLMGHQYQTVKEILPKHRPAHKSHHSTVQLKTTKLKLIFL